METTSWTSKEKGKERKIKEREERKRRMMRWFANVEEREKRTRRIGIKRRSE